MVVGLITRREASGYISSAMNRLWGVSCFSINIRNQLDKNQKGTFFVNKRRRLVRVCLRFNWQCFRDQLLWFCSKFSKKILFYWPVNTDKPNFSLSWYLLVQLLHLPLKFHLSKLLRNDTQNPVLKQWISKDIPSYGRQSERAKIAIHWFGEY